MTPSPETFQAYRRLF